MPDDLTLLDTIIERSWRAADEASIHRDTARVLLEDFCACAAAGARVVPGGDWLPDGRVGRIALLAMRGHAHDRDDIDWSTLTHPGSVIWPVVLGLGGLGDTALAAAAAGYEAMLFTASLLQAASPRWHLTAVAGHAGAAVAAAWIHRLDRSERRNALGLALSVAGGLGATAASRTNGSRWHRAAAATTGAQAALAARAGTTVPADLITAPNGALTVFSAAAEAPMPSAGPLEAARMLAVSVRLYATNGFAQGPVRSAAELRRRLGVAPKQAQVRVAPAVADATAPGAPGGAWWDLRKAVAAALVTGDEWALENPQVYGLAETLELHQRILVEPGPPNVRECMVSAQGQHVRLSLPPGFVPLDSGQELRAKWTAMRAAETAARVANAVLGAADGALQPLLVNAI